MGNVNKPHFDVHPSVVYQLGESLISDAVQALIELVKNCYDADATYAKITINTGDNQKVPGAIYPAHNGQIVVEDDGFGMDEETIKTGWLLISNRTKRTLKQSKETTPRGRTPLGDKGLGRLGVQRLGENLDVFTKTKDGPTYHLAFSWLDFATAPSLKDVDIHFERTSHLKKPGTKVVISNLHEIETWRGQQSLKKLEQELSRMISPYKQIRDFMVYVEVDGKSLELIEVTDRVRDLAPMRYSLKFDGNDFTISGRARLDFFRPDRPSDADEFALLAESDDGQRFFEFLISHKLAQSFNLVRSSSKKWFVEFSYKRRFEDLDKLEPNPKNPKELANPGPFYGEIDSFDLGATSYRQQSVFDTLNEYRRHIKELSGIRVYRDGFAIRVDRDWLKLGAQWTSAPSYYGLKPDNTLGFIALSARENMELEETTDREGFKDTPYYRNFYELLQNFKRFTEKAQEFFRRSWSDFKKKRNEEIARLDSRKDVEDISRTIKKGLAEAASHHRSLETFRTRLEVSFQKSKAVMNKLSVATQVTPVLKSQVEEAFASLEPLIKDAKEVIPRIEGYLHELGALKGMGQVLEDRVDSLRQQIDDMYETVALGLTAEALSHEVFNIADALAKRAKSAQTRLRNKGISDRTVLAFIEYVHSAVITLRKQISFLSPSLRYVREKRDEIVLEDFLMELEAFYRDRLQKNNISIRIIAKNRSLMIRMNRGKMSQIIDNFVLNSEYWLKEDLKHERIKAGEIIFEIDSPFIRIWDNGRGIDPSVEQTLFEPFISMKGRGQGRGLGLFIVKQLLDSEGCHIGVVPERNKSKRLYKFQMDLRGAINE